MRWEIIFVDDGSKDATVATIRTLAAKEPRVRGVLLSRNYGKEIAIAAGLHHADGDAVLLMDADLQHPPEVIPDFLAKWREGYEVIYGIRDTRATDSRLRQLASRAFYRLFRMLSPIQLPRDAGDFRLFDRKAVDALNRMGERVRFTKGLYSWIGFRQTGIPFEVAERGEGQSSFNVRRLMTLAVDGLTAFTTLPLRIWSYVGLAVSLLAFAFALIFLVQTLVFGVDVPGYPSLIVSVTFFAGIQLLSLGVLGEYLGRIFIEVKGRPLYLVAEEISAAALPPPDRVHAVTQPERPIA
jgi:glycosyltransferase involved in cell wall biosynthesis